uniref:Uncharacterized LOC100186365 n=1 Tax=Ciona intestinalis TaxID=7719 RepID=F6WQ49_CIOIN|nr:uncharacterized protein LOC100186365 [Ciona intestinalis]|eukprot:XP_002122293.1 uncharacterized protein LOC100186365 [Ciona intestinalis]
MESISRSKRGSSKKQKSKNPTVPSFGFEGSIQKRWNSAKELMELKKQHTVPHRYEQSPNLVRKFTYRQNSRQYSSDAETPNGRNKKPKQPLDGEIATQVANEKVPLLKLAPWKSSQTEHIPKPPSQPNLLITYLQQRNASQVSLVTANAALNEANLTYDPVPFMKHDVTNKQTTFVSTDSLPPPPSPGLLHEAMKS